MGNHTYRSHFWGPVHSKIEEFRHSNGRFIKGCVILYIVCIFSSSELVKPRIIPLKVRLAVALKGEAKWQVFVRDCEHWILLLYRILILYWAYTCNSVIKSRKWIEGFVLLFFGSKPSGDFRVIILMIIKDDVQKASLTFASGSMVGVGCKLVQFVEYCVCFSWCQLTLKKFKRFQLVRALHRSNRSNWNPVITSLNFFRLFFAAAKVASTTAVIFHISIFTIAQN